eukprot:1143932-Pelagomonas_calceolata.AAC.3
MCLTPSRPAMGPMPIGCHQSQLAAAVNNKQKESCSREEAMLLPVSACTRPNGPPTSILPSAPYKYLTLQQHKSKKGWQFGARNQNLFCQEKCKIASEPPTAPVIPSWSPLRMANCTSTL